MTLPYELASLFDVAHINPNDITVGRSYYYSDASPQIGLGAVTHEIVEYDSLAVAGQIEMVIGTPIGSEEFEPTFGCDVVSRLFDSITQANLNSMELEILDALRKWLSQRLDFLSVNCNRDGDKGEVYVMIAYRVRISGKEQYYVGNLSNMAKFVTT